MSNPFRVTFLLSALPCFDPAAAAAGAGSHRFGLVVDVNHEWFTGLSDADRAAALAELETCIKVKATQLKSDGTTADVAIAAQSAKFLDADTGRQVLITFTITTTGDAAGSYQGIATVYVDNADEDDDDKLTKAPFKGVSEEKFAPVVARIGWEVSA